MVFIRNTDYQQYAGNAETRSRIVAEIFVDEVSELPEPEEIDGYTLCMSSIAYVITTGELYVLGGDGKWH